MPISSAGAFRSDNAGKTWSAAPFSFAAIPRTRTAVSRKGRADGLRPFPSLSVIGGFRYQGDSFPERDGPTLAAVGGAASHADVTATWEPASWLTLSGVSGLMKDLTTGALRRYAGPEVGLPRLLGDVVASPSVTLRRTAGPRAASPARWMRPYHVAGATRASRTLRGVRATSRPPAGSARGSRGGAAAGGPPRRCRSRHVHVEYADGAQAFDVTDAG
jgi:hypothetical protein